MLRNEYMSLRDKKMKDLMDSIANLEKEMKEEKMKKRRKRTVTKKVGTKATDEKSTGETSIDEEIKQLATENRL